jgi:hypothetical protein
MPSLRIAILPWCCSTRSLSVYRIIKMPSTVLPTGKVSKKNQRGFSSHDVVGTNEAIALSGACIIFPLDHVLLKIVGSNVIRTLA